MSSITATNNNNKYLRLAPRPASNKRANIGAVFEMLNWCKDLKMPKEKQRPLLTMPGTSLSHFFAVMLSPRLSDAAMAKLAHATKLLTGGGRGKVFQQEFQQLPGEKLPKASACYRSTSTSDWHTLRIIEKNGVSQRLPSLLLFVLGAPGVDALQGILFAPNVSAGHFIEQVVVDLDQMRNANPSANRTNPSEKYIDIVTNDGYEFWFMGFIFYDIALRTLTEAFHCNCSFSRRLVPVLN